MTEYEKTLDDVAVATGPELAAMVLNQIEREPQSWVQESWLGKTHCGTTGCFAGWAVMLAFPDARPEWGADERCDMASFVTVDYDGEDARYDVDVLAMMLLDIDSYCAEKLFAMDNDLDDIRRELHNEWPDLFPGVDA